MIARRVRYTLEPDTKQGPSLVFLYVAFLAGPTAPVRFGNTESFGKIGRPWPTVIGLAFGPAATAVSVRNLALGVVGIQKLGVLRSYPVFPRRRSTEKSSPELWQSRRASFSQRPLRRIGGSREKGMSDCGLCFP